MKLIEDGKIIQGEQTYIVELQRVVMIEIPVVAETRESAAVKALEKFRNDESYPHAKTWSQNSELLVGARPQGQISPKDWLKENYGEGTNIMNNFDQNLQKVSDDAIDIFEKFYPDVAEDIKGACPEEDLALNLALARLIVGTALVTYFYENRDMNQVNSMASEFSGNLIRWVDEVLPRSFEQSENKSSFKELFDPRLH